MSKISIVHAVLSGHLRKLTSTELGEADELIGRRDFVRRSSGILVAAVAGSACQRTADDPTEPNPNPNPPVGILFSSDFSTGLGTSQNAISDGGKWNLLGGQGQEIVSSAGLNFPTANVLMVNALVVRSGFAMNRKTGIPVPAAPFRRFYRWYYRHAKPFGPHPNQHPVQDGNSFSDVNWSLNINQLTDTTWTPSHEGGPSKRYTTAVALQTNHTYRFELMVDALSATTWRLHIRVFDESGAQVLSDADYREVNNSNDRLADNPILTFREIENLDGLNCGCNGIHNMTQDVVHSYQGGFAVSDTDWIGPYAGGV